MPERGDVAVFKLPSDNYTDYINRIVGLPGDRLQVRDGVLYVNSKPVQRERSRPFYDDDGSSNGPHDVFEEILPSGKSYRVLDLVRDGSLDNTRVYTVPEGYVFAMGDNRDNSLDSRVAVIGPIPVENLVGQAEIIFFSTNASARVWEFWNWPEAIRFERLLQRIE